MVPAVKAGLAVAVVGAGVTGSYFLVTGADPMPTYSTLKSLASGKDGYEGKIGKQYEGFLVAPDKDDSKSWWEWSHRRWKRDSAAGDDAFSDGFKKNKINTTEGNGAKPINKVCDDVYKKNTTDIEGEPKKKLKEDLWKYCSFLAEVPKTIQDQKESHTDGTIGKAQESKLLSVQTNGEWWRVKTEEFYAAAEPTQPYFKKIYKDEKEKPNKQSLKDICRAAYAKTSSTTSGTETAPSPAEVLKHCSLEGK